MINPEALRQLQTDLGREALAAAAAETPTEREFLSVVQRLRKRYPEPLVMAAVEQAILRRRGAAKFSRAGEMYFEREALEQASSEMVSHYRAERLAGFPCLYDLGCGLGGDSLALAAVSAVVAVDRDGLRLSLLAANARALGVEANVWPVRADLRLPAWRLSRRAAGFFDPGRRRNGRRVYSVARYEPPLDLAYTWLPELAALAVKVSPGIDLRQLSGVDCELEFISSLGELKEACLWFGSLRHVQRRATILPGPHSLVSSGNLGTGILPPQGYLYEPDPAILRAGLVGELANRLGASQIDATISYLTSDRAITTPFARVYRVIEVMTSNLRLLRAALRARGVGRLTLKKRGSAIDVASYAQRLRLHGDHEATLILTRAGGRKVALLVEPVAA